MNIIDNPFRAIRRTQEEDKRFCELVESRRQEWRSARWFKKLVVYIRIHIWAWRELQKHRPPFTVE